MAVAIADNRQKETYLDGAFWCSGTLALLDFDGSVKYVFNPFSFFELKTKLGDLDAYLDCVSTQNDRSCTAPTDPVFEAQQIPMLSVYQACLSGYASMSWDPGAFMLFNTTLQQKFKVTVPPVVDTFNVGPCLNMAYANGWSPDACLDAHLQGAQKVDVFVYQNISGVATSKQTDACLAFSGPAAHENANISRPFTACLESYAGRDGCDIPAVIWSGRSKNRIPVANAHVLEMNEETRLKYAMGQVEAVRANVLLMLDKLYNQFTGDGLIITLFSAEGDSLHQCADCMMEGPMSEMVFTPGPDGVERVRWSRGSGVASRLFELPCSGEALTMRNGLRDTKSPFTCGTPARRAILKNYLRSHLGGQTNNSAAKEMVIKAVRELINRTRVAWSYDANLLCTCRNGTVGWSCCIEQENCATEACPCPDGFNVPYSVACCKSVCAGLAGSGIMEPFSSINGSTLVNSLLENLTAYLQNNIWSSNDPWLKFDPLGAEAYRKSWDAQSVRLKEAGLFDTTEDVVYYDETMYPFQRNVTFWNFCAGLLQQIMWTMPLDRRSDRPKMPTTPYDPIEGESKTVNLTYREEFIRALTLEAYKESPVYWTYAVRYIPSSSEVCARTAGRRPVTTEFKVGDATGVRMGFSSMTLGGSVGADCHCGWWNPDAPTATTCKIPNTTCARLVQLLGFTRICMDQRQVYNSTDHRLVLDAMAALIQKDPVAPYPCPSLEISEHWGLMGSDGQPFANATDAILTEGAGGFRVGNVAWLKSSQAALLNPMTRREPLEDRAKVSQQCSWTDTSIADHFINDLFPAAQGVRQSTPQSYCTRYGIELARLTVYQASKLEWAIGEQQNVVDKWRMRCQYKLEQLAVCKAFKVLKATGAPQGTTQCPFSVSVVAGLKSLYAVTPGCLLILWDQPQAGIYDPCVCVQCKGQVLDVPGVLTSLCLLQDLESLVGDGIVPGEVGDVPMGSGSFLDLLNRAGRFSVNTPDIIHWARHTSIRDADMLLDWWPDEWRHPVGYHVTPGCSMTGDAHWKTFNASWRWDPLMEQMVFEPEVADPLLRRNSFGASGVCRSNNYGMPMATLNTMRVCTKENRDAKTDPMVPKPAAPLPWLDAVEYCSDSPFATPWNWSKALNPPRQWSVGTMMQDVLDLYYATEWGTDEKGESTCGPYPLRTCIVDSDCAAGLVCLTARSMTGVCGKKVVGSFECAIHSHCTGDTLCSGDGLCVDGLWVVKNSLADQTISFRTHSQTCPTADVLDTWGTSTAEAVPDILNASGLCSYRSWYENKKMAERNQCTLKDTCKDFTGMLPWNFTSPSVLSQSDSFTDGVLKVRPYPCDRDYQHLEGFSSCTPNEQWFKLRGAAGVEIAKPAGGYARGNRTRTYRVGTRGLPLMHHTENSVSSTYGFTGVPLTYKDLGLGTTGSAIMACRTMKVCGFQNEFRVNGVVIAQRRVMDGATQRGYAMNDLLRCGAFGYQLASGLCRVDYAVAPLVSLALNTFPAWKTTPGFISAGVNALTDTYTPGDASVKARLAMLNKLPGLVLSEYVGGRPTTLQEYVTRSEKFVTLFAEIKKLYVPGYSEEGAGPPRQLYYFAQYGAYEVPFAWWYKCGWIAGLTMGTSTIDSESCGWNTEGNNSQQTTFAPYDNRVGGLYGMDSSTSMAFSPIGLRALLIKLPGVITQAALDAALVSYREERDRWYDRMLAVVERSVRFKCFKRMDYIPSISARSTAYQLQRINQAYSISYFDVTRTYLDDTTGVPLCGSNISCMESQDFSTSAAFNSNFTLALENVLKAVSVSLPSVSLDSTIVSDEDRLMLASFQSATLPVQAWNPVLATFESKPLGCDNMYGRTTLSSGVGTSCLCSRWEDCSTGVKDRILMRQSMASPQPSVAPVVKFFDVDGAVLKEVPVCSGGNLVCGPQCAAAEALNERVVRAEIPPGVELETYTELKWGCVQLTCANTSYPEHNSVVEFPFRETSTRLVEKFVVDEYTYVQHLGGKRSNPWTTASETGERGYFADYVTKGAVRFDADCKDANGRDYSCINGHDVEALGSVNMSVKVIRYYVSGRKKSEITLYPCGFGDVFASKWETVRTSYTRAFNISGVNCSTVGAGGRPNASMYQSAYVRMAAPINYSTLTGNPDYVLERARAVIGSLEDRIDDETCLDEESICPVTVDGSTSGTIQVKMWSGEDNGKMCDVLKTDNVYGCRLFPGEKTWATERCLDLVSGIKDLVIDCKSSSYSTFDRFNNPNIGCGCYTKNSYPNAWRWYHHPYMAECLTNSVDDKCKSKNDMSGTNLEMRDMKLTGRTITYTHDTVIVPCAAGPVTGKTQDAQGISRCQLADEAAVFASTPLAVCPGGSNDPFATSRRTAYWNLMNSDRMNTVVSFEMSTVGTGDSVDVGPFNHMYLGLQPQKSDARPVFACGTCFTNGNCRACGTGEIPTVSCAAGKFPVEMRENLWVCLNCMQVTSQYCTGDHNCMLESPALPLASLSALDGWHSLSADVREYLLSSKASVGVVVDAVKWLANQSASLGVPGVGLPYGVPEFMRPSGNYESPYTYNPLPVIRYDEFMQATASLCGASTGLMPDFTNCSYDTRRRNLKTFVSANYKVPDGIALSPGTTLTWRVHRSQMMAHNIPAWEAMGNKSGMFMTDVLHDKWCLAGNMNDNICYKRTLAGQTIVDVLNPGLLGAFEPTAGCDVEIRDYSRVVSAQCQRCDNNKLTINDIENGESMQCNDGYLVGAVSSSMKAESNLCGKIPEYTSQCANGQGMLGRSQSVYDGGSIQNLYARVPWAAVKGLPMGLRENMLFQGKVLADGTVLSNLVLSPYDIGGHYVSMVLANNRAGVPVLNIVGMPLGSYADPLGVGAYSLSQTTSSNLKWIVIPEAVEVDALRLLYPDPVCRTWDCPLRRRAFYHGKDATFRPMTPDPFRTEVLYGSKAHPTQKASLLKMAFTNGGSSVLGGFKTFNGFCSCRNPPCTACPTDLGALMDGWTVSRTLAGGECAQQVDWPYPGGELRDKSVVAERFTPPSCGLVDRLPEFQYRYWNSKLTIPSERTTLDRGGVCAMGWPIVYTGPLAGCYLLVDRDTFMCTGNVERPVVRMKARTLSSLMYATSRSRLSECKMPPGYRFPSGTSTASEVSYGQLKRLETSRLLANDLRQRLCGNATTCAATKDWSLPTFWAGVFVKDLPALPSGNNSNLSLWTEPWVACLQADNGTMDCDGVVSRDEWLSPTTRGPACIKALRESKYADKLTRNINICDLDSTLDQFCRTIQDARYEVYEANCLYSGQCRQQLFFYQPSTYAVDNGEFVRSTVQTFYNNTVYAACVPDIDTAAALEGTARALENCAAMQLNVLVDCIHIIRLIVDDLVELVYLVCKLWLYIFQLIGQPPSKQQKTIDEMNALLNIIKGKFLSVINQFGNLLYRMIMGGPLGKWLEGAIKTVCELIKFLIQEVVYKLMCWGQLICLIFLDVVAMPIVKGLNAIAGNSLDWMISGVGNAKQLITDNIPCRKLDAFKCDLSITDNTKPSSVLPAPTRCWAGVQPGIGSLGCTAADTCLNDEFDLVNCGVCVGASSMIKFGCSTLTKLCSCNVFPTGVSSCSSHEQCQMDEEDIDCQYVDSYLEPSYGNVPCRQCSNPICLITDSSGIGQCSCLLRPVSHQSCNKVAQRVSPNAAELCLVAVTASASENLGSTNDYLASFRTLASVPCLLLNQAQTYCVQVFKDGSVWVPLVVGRSLLMRRRALLSDGMLERLIDTPLISNVSAWDGEGQPCRALVLANESQLGILELFYRSECWRWRDVGSKIVADENMTHVSPYFMVSWRDMLYTLLTPDSITEIAAKVPSIINGLLLHSEITQPLYVAVLYWTQLIPKIAWSNATLLDNTRAFFINQTFYFNGPTLQEPIPKPPQPNVTTSIRRRLMAMNDGVSAEMVYEWSRGPYQWPPNYKYWDNAGQPSCAIVSTALNVFKNALSTTVSSYRTARPEPLPIVWPTILPMRNWSDMANVQLDTSSLEGFMSGLTDAWLDKSTIRKVVQESPWVRLLKSFIRCDFEVVQTCSERRSLMWSAIQVAVILVGVSLVARLAGIPYVDFLMAILYVPCVMYAAYGYAFTCAPLIPVCLLEDAFELVDWLLPSSIDWPAELVTRPNCTEIDCMRSCRYDTIVGFSSVEEHIAWIVCEADTQTGKSLANTLPWDLLEPMRTALARKCALWDASDSMRKAQRVCWALTIVNSTPILLLLLAASWFIPTLLGAIVSLAQFAVTSIVSLVLFVHSSAMDA